MDGELEEVAQVYENTDRMTTMHHSVTVDELARIFEAEEDFVHFIGHCEVGGLKCQDGTLDIESLSSVGVRTFFLNACGSYRQGQALIERGSVAGAVTLRKCSTIRQSASERRLPGCSSPGSGSNARCNSPAGRSR